MINGVTDDRVNNKVCVCLLHNDKETKCLGLGLCSILLFEETGVRREITDLLVTDNLHYIMFRILVATSIVVISLIAYVAVNATTI